jgi:putative transposase
MPRIGRAVAPGYPHHVIQRGNNRENVFFEKEDRTKYLSLLNKYAFKWNAPIMAYCLMSNHIHLLTKPLSEESLFKMMQGLTLCYTQYINRMYGRTGRLWESRYHSCIVDYDKYLWAVARYIGGKQVTVSNSIGTHPIFLVIAIKLTSWQASQIISPKLLYEFQLL